MRLKQQMQQPADLVQGSLGCFPEHGREQQWLYEMVVA